MRYRGFIICLPLLLASCGSPTKVAAPVSLKGAGATAPNIVYGRWFQAFKVQEPRIRLDYALTGSGEGIRRLARGEVDFAGSDVPLSDAEMKQLSIDVLHFPTLVGGIVPVYNLPGVNGRLHFTGDTLAGIFSDRIRMWNDPALSRDNPGRNLPANRIVVVHRSDASGSSYAFTDFLSRTSESWRTTIGSGPAVAWPAGRKAGSSNAVCAAIRQTPNAIGYVELNFAEQEKLAYGAVKNAAGKFQTPTLEALGGALDGARDLERDYRASIANASGPESYPIATLTWLLVPRQMKTSAKLEAMQTFLRWVYRDGQKIASPTDYGTLPAKILYGVRAQVEQLRGPAR